RKNGGLTLLYLLFCWTLIPTVVSIFDFFYFLIITDEKFNDKYNTYIHSNNFKLLQKEIDNYNQYIQETDLDFIKNGQHRTGSYNYVFQNLIASYQLIVNSPPTDIKKYVP